MHFIVEKGKNVVVHSIVLSKVKIEAVAIDLNCLSDCAHGRGRDLCTCISHQMFWDKDHKNVLGLTAPCKVFMCFNVIGEEGLTEKYSLLQRYRYCTWHKSGKITLVFPDPTSEKWKQACENMNQGLKAVAGGPT